MNVDLKSPARTSVQAVRPASGREHLVTVLLGLWMTIGLFLDGYFHQNLDGDGESFLTPWHAAFYAGFGASTLWLMSMSRRRGATNDWQLRTLPPGYAGARFGIAVFAVGGVGDALWHAGFGVERGVDALLSPTHLLLFVGLVLILTAPIRAAAAAPEAAPSPWMTVGSLTCATALVGFFLNFAWGLGVSSLARVPYDPVTEVGETEVIAGVASTVITTGVLFLAARVLLRRPPPVGAFVVLFGVVSLLVSVAFDEDGEGVVAAVVAGLALEALCWSRGRRAHASTDPWMSFGVASALLWFTYLALVASFGGIEWQAEIWMGTVALNALVASALGAPVAHTEFVALRVGHEPPAGTVLGHHRVAE